MPARSRLLISNSETERPTELSFPPDARQIVAQLSEDARQIVAQVNTLLEEAKQRNSAEDDQLFLQRVLEATLNWNPRDVNEAKLVAEYIGRKLYEVARDRYMKSHVDFLKAGEETVVAIWKRFGGSTKAIASFRSLIEAASLTEAFKRIKSSGDVHKELSRLGAH